MSARLKGGRRQAHLLIKDLTRCVRQHHERLSFHLRAGSRLARAATVGPVREQHHRSRSSLLAEIGLAPLGWTGCSSTPAPATSNRHHILQGATAR